MLYTGEFVRLTRILFPRSYQIVIGGSASFSGGTSAAAPLIAGMIGLLNDARLRAGKPVMGFLNPWLYSEGYKALTDVVGGNSKGCDGWDTQSGREVPGAGIVGERGAYWNGTEGRSSLSSRLVFPRNTEWLTDAF